MGGKGGGGGGQDAGAAINAMFDTTSHPGYYIRRADNGYGNMAGEVSDANGKVLGTSDSMWPEPAPAKQEAAPAQQEAAAPAAEEQAPADPTPVAPIGDAVSAGGAVDQPGAAAPASGGDVLGGAILKPPKYWTGNISNFKSGSASRGKMTTTQT